ncbi:MAG TPA: GntR family transcriptional regulator [Candidatus Mcinerneyibacterium sp.]|nr:GntR family transcriptional regulator [Candidatus Mcinerneyibacterium sp.]
MDILISNSSEKPIYKQVKNQIKENILSGNITENTKLPSIRTLAKDLQISVITTKRAYKELEKEGLVETVKGKGTYVASKNKELYREKKLNLIEEKLFKIIEEAKILGLKSNEFIDLVKILYQEEDKK